VKLLMMIDDRFRINGLFFSQKASPQPKSMPFAGSTDGDRSFNGEIFLRREGLTASVMRRRSCA
jgi:hypothetical protein